MSEPHLDWRIKSEIDDNVEKERQALKQRIQNQEDAIRRLENKKRKLKSERLVLRTKVVALEARVKELEDELSMTIVQGTEF